MSFSPVVPFSGYAGWAFLKRTREAQQTAFDNSPAIRRDTAYFAEKIGSVKTSEALVGDRRLLGVALGAFGLDSDIGNKFFVRKVLDDGSLETGALANRMSDKRYLALTKAFGFGDFDTPRTVLSSFGQEIVSSYRDRQFEVAVGEKDQNLRLAMGLGRDLATITKRDTSDNGYWYAVMGNSPVRKVFEAALGLPSSFGQLDLDRQLDGFRTAASKMFGGTEVKQFSDPEKQEKLIRMFLIRSESQLSAASTVSGQNALTLLQNSGLTRQRLYGA